MKWSHRRQKWDAPRRLVVGKTEFPKQLLLVASEELRRLRYVPARASHRANDEPALELTSYVAEVKPVKASERRSVIGALQGSVIRIGDVISPAYEQRWDAELGIWEPE